MNTTYFALKGIPESCCKFQNCTEAELKDLNKAKAKVYDNVSESQRRVLLCVLEAVMGMVEL